MRARYNKEQIACGAVVIAAIVGLLTACSGSGGDSGGSVTTGSDVSVAYVKRPSATMGNPTDSIMTGQGGDLYIRDKSSPSSSETNITGSETQGQGDVSDPEVSYDGSKLLFAMHRPQDTTWGIWEYNISRKQLRRITCDASAQGDDVDPAYLPDGRIVFVSNRQEGTKRQMQAQGITPYTYVDEYEREATTALHVMNSDGTNCKQISFNQSHDRNPTVLRTGEIMFARWDHVGERNQFSIFKVNPDGTNLFVVYGAHSPGNSYLHSREMADGRVISSLMPLSRTREGGSLEIIDINNYSDIDSPGSSNPPANQLGQQRGQFQVTRLLFSDRSDADHEAMRNGDISPLGRYSTPYPLWDGTNRVLTVFTPSQPVQSTNALGQPVTVEGTPRYGIYMLDLSNKTLRPVVLPQDGYYYSDPVAIQARPVPTVKSNFTPDPTIGTGLGLFDVNTVYDTDSRERMGNAVLAGTESIPRDSLSRPDIANLKLPGTSAYANRVARFVRLTKAVPLPAGMDRMALGETENEMQQIVGYAVIEPDGSIRARVPADTAVNIAALDKDGRAFTPHTHWIQAREGERRFCKGCHSSRLGTTDPSGGSTLNDPARVGIHPGGTSTTTMAQTRASGDATYANLKRDPSYTDYWTTQYNASATPEASITLSYAGSATPTIKGPASCATTWSAKDCAIVINYPDHIQPILTAKCVSCHSGTSASAGIDLTNAIAGAFGRVTSYQELLVGDTLLDANGQPIITVNDDGEVMIARESPPVVPSSARDSRLIERLFEQTLKAGAASVSSTRAFCRAGGASCVNGATYQNHSAMLNVAEKRLISEWIDIGGQYYNDPFDGSGNLRTAAAQLSESVFACKVQPVLQAACASCHAPFGGNGLPGAPTNPSFASSRFVLTGNTGADFSVTASMVTNLAVPDSSLLLYRPSRSVTDTPAHPGATAQLPMGSANYTTLRGWIAGTLTCQ